MKWFLSLSLAAALFCAALPSAFAAGKTHSASHHSGKRSHSSASHRSHKRG